MTLEELNKKYAKLKRTAEDIEKAMKKFEGSNKVENYLGYESLKIARECVITEMNKFINRDWVPASNEKETTESIPTTPVEGGSRGGTSSE